MHAIHLPLTALTVAGALQAQVAWSELTPTTDPGVRVGHAMAFDEARGVTVLFGGGDGPTTFGDTWTFDGTSWTQVAVTGPAPRTGHVLVYDPLRQVVVLFGGDVAGVGIVADTWEWDGVTWTQKNPATVPAARTLAAGAPWPAWGGIVVHGGYPLDATPFFWSFDGSDWTYRGTAATPAAAAHALAYHPVQQRLLLFGDGRNLQFDGSDWIESDPSATPRRGVRLVYDPFFQRILMWGGVESSGGNFAYFDETWAWDGIWSRLDVGPTPGGRSDFAMAFDVVHQSLLVHGGMVSSWFTGAQLDDTWALAPVSSPTPYTEATATGFGFSTTCAYQGSPPFSATTMPILFTSGERAWIGETFPVDLSRFGTTFAQTLVVLAYGTSNTTWSGVPLPLPLFALGRPDCDLLVAPEITAAALAGHGISWPVAVPNGVALVGSAHYFQALGLTPGGVLFTSNGVGVVIGQR